MSDLRSFTTTVALILAGAFAAACGGGDSGSTAATSEPSGGGEAAAPAMVADAGTITGMVNFAGVAPANSPIDMSEEPDCAAKHTGGAMTQTVMAENGKLANVFIYIKEGLTGSYPASGSVEVDQDGCVYHPHVVGVMTGQDLDFKNSDGLAHNVQATPANNRPFNISQPMSMTSAPQRFNTPEIMIPVQCSIHGWMKMYVGVVAHPYFAVSATDGSFSIGNVPPGTYTIEAWHEHYGTMQQQVTVDPNGTATMAFDYSDSMALNANVPLGEPIDPHNHTAAEIAAHAAAAQPETR